jgi:ribulose-5-phosphate 4-epimerase/fuculose-1-phosphate aldolase
MSSTPGNVMSWLQGGPDSATILHQAAYAESPAASLVIHVISEYEIIPSLSSSCMRHSSMVVHRDSI